MLGYLVISGETHALAIHRAPGGGYRLQNGKPIALLTPGGPARLQIGEARHEVHIAFASDSIWIHLNGRAHEVLWRDAVDQHAEASDGTQDGAVRAPMPGAVVSVLVQAGDLVSAGDPVMVIESMKLETTVRASRVGAVVGVRAAPGETFERNAILIEIGPSD